MEQKAPETVAMCGFWIDMNLGLEGWVPKVLSESSGNPFNYPCGCHLDNECVEQLLKCIYIWAWKRYTVLSSPLRGESIAQRTVYDKMFLKIFVSQAEPVRIDFDLTVSSSRTTEEFEEAIRKDIRLSYDCEQVLRRPPTIVVKDGCTLHVLPKETETKMEE